MSTLGKCAFSLAISLCLLSPSASGFPENIRHGYDSCAACHVSPAGGGTLTDYGRGTSEAFMATWGGDGWGDAFYGLPKAVLPAWIRFGGDQRAVELLRTDPATHEYVSTYVPMEDDFEVAVSPPNNPGVTVDAEAGVYGPDHLVQYRRLFVKVDLSANVGVRAGHFIPSYGVNLPDHTTPIRRELGLGQGGEEWAAEAYWLAPKGELELTSIFGSDTTVDLNSRRPGAYQTDTATGWAARAAVYTSGSSQVGVSAMDVSSFDSGTLSGGLFGELGFAGRGFLLAEVDQKRVATAGAAPVAETVAMVKVGAEAYQGVLPYVQLDTVDATLGARAGVQWIPVPHVELAAEVRRNWGVGFRAPTTSGLVLIHHWI